MKLAVRVASSIVVVTGVVVVVVVVIVVIVAILVAPPVPAMAVVPHLHRHLVRRAATPGHPSL